MNLIQFGAMFAGTQQKQAAGAGRMAAGFGGMLGDAATAAKKPTVAVGRQLPAPPLPPPPPPRVKVTPQDVANVPTPGKVTVSPAEAAAGRAKVTVTPQDVAGVPGKNYGSVPNKPITSSAAQSYFDNATSGGRQRMLGFDPQARPAPAPAPRSWADLSPEQQQAVHSFYTGGKSGSAKSFGAKVAQAQSAQELVDAAKDVRDEANASGKIVVKKLDSAKNKKTAASSCTPCDMPNGPTNKKHMTGASPAVLEADEASEEIGQPETTETKHDKSVVTGKEARTKKASPVGLPPVNPAINIQLPSVHDVAKQTALFTAPIGAVVGGAIGGFGSKKNKLRNMLLGALKGTAVGAAGGAGTVYGGRYLPELIGNTTGASAAVPSAVLAGGAGGGLLAGGLTGAGFDALAGGDDEEEPKKQARARAFGRKIAAVNGDAIAAEYGHPRAPVYGNPPPPPAPSAPDYLPQNPGEQLANKVQRWPHLAGKFKADAAKADAASKATKWPQRSWLDYVTTGEAANDIIAKPLAGTRDALASGIAYATTPGSKAKAVNTPEARAAIGGTQEARDAVTSVFGSGDQPKPQAQQAGMFGGLDPMTALKYGIPIGLGGAGLYALYNYLNSKPKKKTEDEKEKA